MLTNVVTNEPYCKVLPVKCPAHLEFDWICQKKILSKSSLKKFFVLFDAQGPQIWWILMKYKISNIFFSIKKKKNILISFNKYEMFTEIKYCNLNIDI